VRGEGEGRMSEAFVRFLPAFPERCWRLPKTAACAHGDTNTNIAPLVRRWAQSDAGGSGRYHRRLPQAALAATTAELVVSKSASLGDAPRLRAVVHGRAIDTKQGFLSATQNISAPNFSPPNL
jgi:hypothetical protein